MGWWWLNRRAPPSSDGRRDGKLLGWAGSGTVDGPGLKTTTDVETPTMVGVHLATCQAPNQNEQLARY